jgi:hypothetical protein
MSAWIVSKAHIDGLVQAAIVEQLVKVEHATSVGQDAWRENCESVAYRYSEPLDPCWKDYRFAGIEAPLDDAVVMHAISCFDYQSCEHPGWETSLAHDLFGHEGSLGKVIVARHDGDENYRSWGNRDLPWGVDHIEQYVRQEARS